LRTYYSKDETDLYVLTAPLPRLQLKEAPEPSDAPLYMDLETGEAYHPGQISSGNAETVARYAAKESPGNSVFELVHDTERWRKEFSDLFDQVETGPVKGYSIDLDERPDAGSLR
jgi:hypothetical protein